MDKETSMWLLAGCHLYEKENTCILIVRVYLTILNTLNTLT